MSCQERCFEHIVWGQIIVFNIPACWAEELYFMGNGEPPEAFMLRTGKIKSLF